MDISQREKQSMLAVNVGLAANILLAMLKTSVGVLGQSPALLADGINSTSDVAYYLVVAAFMKRAGKPPDYEHPYGHRQLESIASLIVGSFVITAAVAIFWMSLFSGTLSAVSMTCGLEIAISPVRVRLLCGWPSSPLLPN